MARHYVRSLFVFENHFIEFKKRLPKDALKKMYQVFLLIMTVPIVPVKYLKAIASVDGLYEIRFENNGNAYRVFCCFDEGQIIVLLDGIQKKSQKTPKDAIEKARILMNRYFVEKELGYECE